MSTVNINQDNFEEEVLNSNKKVLVDFWAGWCNPCRMMSKVIEEIADEMQEELKVCKVNVDDNAKLAIKYNVSSIPAFVIFKNGNVENMTVGVQSKKEIMEFLK